MRSVRWVTTETPVTRHVASWARVSSVRVTAMSRRVAGDQQAGSCVSVKMVGVVLTVTPRVSKTFVLNIMIQFILGILKINIGLSCHVIILFLLGF